MNNRNNYQSIQKPFLDFTIALIALVMLSPIFLLLMVTLFFINNGNVFFYQLRPGLNGKLFTIIKFKTMHDAKDAQGNLLSDELRLKKVGSLVRKASLDEIPQLINVLLGEMSIVGPRPLLPEYLGLYNAFEKRRHEVKPGITGWAQINGRNIIDWETKFSLDVWYVDNISFWLDMKILFLTLNKVLLREGVTSKNSATVDAFKGNNK